MVFVEQLTSAVYLDQRADVEHYLGVADQLSGEALTPADTIGYVWIAIGTFGLTAYEIQRYRASRGR